MTSLLLALLEGATTGDKSLVIMALSSQHTDPRARAALEKMAAEDPDPSLREYVAETMRGSSGRN